MQEVVNSLVTGAASFSGGFMMGYTLKKVIRIIVIALGAIAGIFLVVLALLQKQGYVSAINWDKISSDIYTSTNATLTNIHINSIQHTIGYLGIPITGGLGLGLVSGFLRG